MAPQATGITFLAVPTTTIAIDATVTLAQTPFYLAPVWRATSTRSTEYVDASCTPFALPSFGRLSISPTETLTLDYDAMFTPLCVIDGGRTYLNSSDNAEVVSDAAANSAFYSSTVPMTYAVAATTVVAYILFLLLLVSAPGSRPWLQKVATFSVVVSLTIAWSEMNNLVQSQYDHGYFSASQIRTVVVGGEVIRISRVISDTFLYLAQVQTLIRLFPRHREKVVIKWAGFALIVLDTVFSIINNFVSPRHPDKGFLDAVPTLSYLLQIAISFLYVSCVIYYALGHRQFAFLPPLSIRNQHRHAAASSQVAMPLIAMLSISAILVPIVFFVLDISNANLAGWGDFVRWVGAAAASVVVWEWVDRIEGLEELGRKRGILGRQVFDGDEMLEGVGGTIINWDHSKGGGSEGSQTSSVDQGGGLAQQRETSRTTRVLNVTHSNPNTTRQSHLRAGSFFPTLTRATSGSTNYRIRIHPTTITTPPPAHLSTNTNEVPSRAASALAGTISDLAISPAGTPSVEDRIIPVQRNITFGEDTSVHRRSPAVTEPEMPGLAHVHRSGQAPFRPEDFASTGDTTTDRTHRRFNLFKRRRADNEELTIPPSQNLIITAATTHLSQEVNLLQPAVPTRTHSVPSIYSGDTSLQPNGSFQFGSPVGGSDRGRGLSTILAKSRKMRKAKVAEPLPVTIIPPLRRGEIVDLRDVERAREIERARQFPQSQISSSTDSEDPDNSGEGESSAVVAKYVTRFGGTPDQDHLSAGRSSRTDSDNGRVSSIQGHRASPMGIDGQPTILPHQSSVPPSISPTSTTFRSNHSVSFYPVALTITPPPPATTASVLSPSTSVGSSSIASRQYRGASPPAANISTPSRSPSHQLQQHTVTSMVPPYTHQYHHQQSSLTTERDVIEEEDWIDGDGEEGYYDEEFGEAEASGETETTAPVIPPETDRHTRPPDTHVASGGETYGGKGKGRAE